MRSLLRAGVLGLPLVATLLVPGAVRAESGLVLPLPVSFGHIDAGTYDEAGNRIGDAQLAVERLASGDVRLESTSAIDGSAKTVLSATLRPLPDGSGLRLVSQESRSKDERGNALGVMRIDHERREGICIPPAGQGKPDRLELPVQDRVVNVPLPLLFRPLVEGNKEEVKFQLFLCRSGARLIDARASLAGSNGERVIEVRYDMDLGPLLSRLAGPFLPRLSVWFDPDESGSWLGHRVPLFAKGPTVLVVRRGVSPALLGASR